MERINLDDYFKEFEGWQKKVLFIGSDLNLKAKKTDRNPVMDSVAHLQQEYAEVQRSLQRYGLKPSKENAYYLVAETGDIVNVSGILLGILKEPVPLEIMLLKLYLKSKKFNTTPSTEYTASQQYTTKHLFEFWASEVISIGKQLKARDTNTAGIRTRYSRLSGEYITLLEEIDHFSRDDSYKAEVLESLGDFINISAIMMSIISQKVPFGRLTDKLYEKDRKFKTGQYIDS